MHSPQVLLPWWIDTNMYQKLRPWVKTVRLHRYMYTHTQKDRQKLELAHVNQTIYITSLQFPAIVQVEKDKGGDSNRSGAFSEKKCYNEVDPPLAPHPISLLTFYTHRGIWGGHYHLWLLSMFELVRRGSTVQSKLANLNHIPFDTSAIFTFIQWFFSGV